MKIAPAASLAAGGVFLALLALYACTAYRTTGPGDSVEFAIAMTTWGVPHAPGYPLLCLFGNVVTAIAGRGTAVAILNVLNAAFAAGAAAFVVLAVTVAGGAWWAGGIAALALGTAQTFWTQALATEVLAPNELVAALLLFLFACLLAERKSGRRGEWALVGIATALTTAVTHHTTIVLLGLPIAIAGAWIMVSERHMSRTGSGRFPLPAQIAVVVLAGALPLLYLPLAASRDPALNWGDPSTLQGFLHVLLRKDFGTSVLTAPSITAAEILQHGEPADPAGGRHLWFLLLGLPRQLGWGLVLCALVGAAEVARRQRPWLAVAALFALALLVFFGRVNAPVTPLYVEITERFHVLPQVFVAFLGGIGLASLATWLGARGRIAGIVAAFAVAAESVFMHLAGLPARDMRANTFTGDLGINFLAGMPPRALAFTDGDLFRNSALLAQTTVGLRPDVTLVDPRLMSTSWYIAQLRRRHSMVLPDSMTAYTGTPGTDVRSWLDLNLEGPGGRGRPIVAMRLPDESWKSAYRQIPMGLWLQVRRREDTPDLASWSRRFSAIVAQWRVGSIAGPYPSNTWEGTQSVFYRYALGSLQAVRDIAQAYAPADPSPTAVPALEIAGGWRGAERADFLAFQADLWRSCLEDSLIPNAQPSRALAFDRATQLAEESLTTDSTDVQALQTLAWLRGAQGDIAAEVRLRHRIVRERPGDSAELIAYFTSEARAKHAGLPEYAALLAQAEAARARAVRVLKLAAAHKEDPGLTRLREELSTPFVR